MKPKTIKVGGKTFIVGARCHLPVHQADIEAAQGLEFYFTDRLTTDGNPHKALWLISTCGDFIFQGWDIGTWWVIDTKPPKSIKPAHTRGEICKAERHSDMKPCDFDNFIFRFTGEHRESVSGEFILTDEKWLGGRGEILLTFLDTVGKHWILTRERKKKQGQKTTVTTFDIKGNKSSYCFYGKPDYPRIERENLIEGDKLALIVSPFQATRTSTGFLRISKRELKLTTGGFETALRLDSDAWFSGFSMWKDTEAEIRNAILHHKPIRPATREDFMVEFNGVKVWMEKHGYGRLIGCMQRIGSAVIKKVVLDILQADIYKRGGVMFMPEEFWKEK